MLNSFVVVAVRAVTNPPPPPCLKARGSTPRVWQLRGRSASLYIRYLVSVSRVVPLYPLTHTKTSQHPAISQNLYNFAKYPGFSFQLVFGIDKSPIMFYYIDTPKVWSKVSIFSIIVSTSVLAQSITIITRKGTCFKCLFLFIFFGQFIRQSVHHSC